jgi:hypothetical protein
MKLHRNSIPFFFSLENDRKSDQNLFQFNDFAQSVLVSLRCRRCVKITSIYRFITLQIDQTIQQLSTTILHSIKTTLFHQINFAFFFSLKK